MDIQVLLSLSICYYVLLTLVSGLSNHNNGLTSNTRNLRQVFYPGNYIDEQEKSFSNGGGGRNGTDNRKPAFRNCKGYAPSVKEEQPSNNFVIKVEADDPDPSDSIEYSFVMATSERPKFRIDSKTGDIYTSHTFDRDEPIREKEVCVFCLMFYPDVIILYKNDYDF